LALASSGDLLNALEEADIKSDRILLAGSGNCYRP
jgi:hypothetical protein